MPTIFELVRARKRLRRARSARAPWGRSTVPLVVAVVSALAVLSLPSGDGRPWMGATARAAFERRVPDGTSWGTRVLVMPVVNECQDPEAGRLFVADLATALAPLGLRLVSGEAVTKACEAEGLKAELVGPGREMARLLDRTGCRGALRIRFQTLLAAGSDEVSVAVGVRGYAGDGRSLFSRNLNQGFDGTTLLEDAVSAMARKAARVVEGHRDFFFGPPDASLALFSSSSAADAAPSPSPAPSPSGTSDRFRDVPRGHWARAAIERLRDAGIVEGFEKAFHGDRPFTRYEMAVVADRFLSALRALESRMMESEKVPVVAEAAPRPGEPFRANQG